MLLNILHLSSRLSKRRGTKDKWKWIPMGHAEYSTNMECRATHTHNIPLQIWSGAASYKLPTIYSRSFSEIINQPDLGCDTFKKPHELLIDKFWGSCSSIGRLINSIRNGTMTSLASFKRNPKRLLHRFKTMRAKLSARAIASIILIGVVICFSRTCLHNQSLQYQEDVIDGELKTSLKPTPVIIFKLPRTGSSWFSQELNRYL